MSYAGESGPLDVRSEVRSFDLSSPEDTAAFAEILKEVDPQGTGCPNASVSVLVAALQAERRRADELQKDLDAAFEGWTDEASSAHRSSLDWQLRAGRYYVERNSATGNSTGESAGAPRTASSTGPIARPAAKATPAPTSNSSVSTGARKASYSAPGLSATGTRCGRIPRLQASVPCPRSPRSRRSGLPQTSRLRLRKATA